MVIVLVVAEMLCEIVDSLSEQRNLNLGRAGITLVATVLLDDCALFFCCKAH
jgi:hypothetical protein